jgi:hypothetical protein
LLTGRVKRSGHNGLPVDSGCFLCPQDARRSGEHEETQDQMDVTLPIHGEAFLV